ncbi:MAG: tryptophan synthase subunit alpha [Bacteroidota bacterium]
MEVDSTVANRIDRLFKEKGERILSVYFTAGYPQTGDTMQVAQALQEAAADIIEIGMPYSDPIADGPTIQESSKISLDHGMTIALLFEQLASLRMHVDIPVILMGYINPVLQYGIERFCQQCQQLGVDGLILPDLPMHEYQTEYKPVFDAHGLYNIFLITPQTSEERIREIDEHSNGFIYMVSSASTTGAKDNIEAEQVAYFNRIRDMRLNNPTLIGFGISNKDTFDKACEYASGAIIGSAFIKAIQSTGDLTSNINQFITSIKG